MKRFFWNVLLLVGMVSLLGFSACKDKTAKNKTQKRQTSTPQKAALVVDPVCKMKIDPKTAKGGHHTHKGKTYHFCHPKCKENFVKNPDKYLKTAHKHHGADKKMNKDHKDHGADKKMNKKTDPPAPRDSSKKDPS